MKAIYKVIPFENIVFSRWVANRLRKMDSAEKNNECLSQCQMPQLKDPDPKGSGDRDAHPRRRALGSNS